LRGIRPVTSPPPDLEALAELELVERERSSTDRLDDVVRVQGPAVVELDAVAELEPPTRAAGRAA